MNLKKKLENRIRGWVPQEPKMSKSSAKMDFRIKLPSFTPSQLGKGNFRTAKVIGVNCGLCIIIFILSTITLYNFKAGLGSWGITGIGLFFGLVSGAWATPRILKRTENHKDSLGWKEYLGVTVPALILFLLATQVASVFSENFIVAWVTTYTTIQVVLFLSYERKKKLFIIQNGWFGVVYSLVPQDGKIDSVQGQSEKIVTNEELSEKIRLSSRLGYVGGFLFVFLSMIQILNSGSGFFWWGGTLFSSEIVIFSGIVGLASGFIGLYGAFIGKKLGGSIMLLAGLIGSIGAPIYGIAFGILLIVGGTAAILEKSQTTILS